MPFWGILGSPREATLYIYARYARRAWIPVIPSRGPYLILKTLPQSPQSLPKPREIKHLPMGKLPQNPSPNDYPSYPKSSAEWPQRKKVLDTLTRHKEY